MFCITISATTTETGEPITVRYFSTGTGVVSRLSRLWVVVEKPETSHIIQLVYIVRKNYI